MKQSLNILTHSITAVCSLAYGIFQETQKSVELIIGEEAGWNGLRHLNCKAI